MKNCSVATIEDMFDCLTLTVPHFTVTVSKQVVMKKSDDKRLLFNDVG